nr:ArsA family ATPase [Amycolatopsis aidingensis]
MSSALRFFGGKGGVGKTTLAAAFGLLAAGEGTRTLVVSTDPAHSLGDALATPLGERPRQVADRLWAAEVSGEAQAGKRLEEITRDAERTLPREVLPAVRTHLRRAVGSPGTVESALLDRLIELTESAEWELLVVDSAPTGHMLRLLTLPALLTPWIEGLAQQRRSARDVDRMATGALGSAAEADPLLDRLQERRARMERMAQRLRTDALVHLVLVPERLPLAETLRTAGTLTESGVRLGPMIVNRVLPEGEAGLLARRRRQQEEVLGQLEGYRQVRVPLLAGALTGQAELAALAELLAAAGLPGTPGADLR